MAQTTFYTDSNDVLSLAGADAVLVAFRSVFMLLAVLVAILWTWVDLHFNLLTSSYPFFLTLALGGIAGFILNRFHFFWGANVTLLLVGNFVIFAFSTVNDIGNGVSVLFIPAAILPLVLFEDHRKRWGIWFSGLSLLLFTISFFASPNIVSYEISFPPAYLPIIFYGNLVIAMVFTVLSGVLIHRLNSLRSIQLRESNDELARISQDLFHLNERLETAIQGSGIGVYEWDTEAGDVYLSDEWKRILGYANGLQATTFHELLELLHPEDRETVPVLQQTALTAAKPYQLEYRIRNSCGSYTWVADNGVPRRSTSPGNMIYVGLLRDITARKEEIAAIRTRNQLLEEANRRKDYMISGASHDLKSPLHAMMGIVTQADQENSDPAVGAYLDLLQEQLQHLDRFVEDVVESARDTHAEPRMQEVELAALVTDMVDVFLSALCKDCVTIDVKIEPDICIHTDYYLLYRVLFNLIGNAIKYRDEQKLFSQVTISAEETDACLLITIADNGIGIGENHQNYIFDMFYRISDDANSSGLGLYVAREITTRLGGSLDFESQAGQGSTFFLHFPRNYQKREQSKSEEVTTID